MKLFACNVQEIKRTYDQFCLFDVAYCTYESLRYVLLLLKIYHILIRAVIFERLQVFTYFLAIDLYFQNKDILPFLAAAPFVEI